MIYTFPEKYINLLTDFGFKRIFGSEPNKALLMDFLNTLLPPQHQIQALTFKNTEKLGSTPANRKAIFDVYCQSATGERFIVEVQKAKQNYFKDRSVYYASFPIQEQAPTGEWDFKLQAVYTVGVLDFIFDDPEDEPDFLHVVELKNQRCEVFYDKLKFVYLELPKFEKSLEELTSQFEKWVFLLKRLPELAERPPQLQDDVFEQLFEAARIANFSPAERERYHHSLKHYRDLDNVVATSRQEGWQEGWQEGQQEGRQAERQEIAQSMKADGMSPQDIAKFTGLSPKEIDAL